MSFLLNPFIFASALPVFGGAQGDEVDRSEYTFTGLTIGDAYAGRKLFIMVYVRHAGATQDYITSLTLDGGGAIDPVFINRSYEPSLDDLVSSSTTTGKVYIVDWPTGTDVDAVVTCFASSQYCSIGVYAIPDDADYTLHHIQKGSGTDSSAVVSNQKVVAGGYIFGRFTPDGGGSPTSVSYTGADTATIDAGNGHTPDVGRSNFFHVETTETVDTNDITMDWVSSSAYGLVVYSLVPSYTSSTALVKQHGNESNAALTTYPFSCPLGPNRSGRMFVVSCCWEAAATRSIVDIRLGGVSFGGSDRVVQAGTSGGSFVAWLPDTTLENGVLEIEFDGNCQLVSYHLYNTKPTSTTPLDSGSSSGTGTTVTVADIEVANGGFLIMAARDVGATSQVVSYNGSDTLVQDALYFNAIVENFGHYACATTESVSTNDPGITGANAQKRITVVSWS